MGDHNHNVKGKWKQIGERERYQIEALLKARKSPREIAEQLKYNRTTIMREIKRGSVIQRNSDLTEEFRYCADVGQRVHNERASKKGRGYKIAHDHVLAQYIENKIKKGKYSPDAVIGEIKSKGLEFKQSICTKTLYNYIDNDLFHTITNDDLPVKKNKKKRKKNKIKRSLALNNTNGRSIEERPVEIEQRGIYGHWEMDCVVGSGQACLLVLTERSTRTEMIFKMEEKTQKCVIAVINKLEMKYQKEFSAKFKSITMDNGGEFINQSGIESSCLQSDEKRTTCYYAHPYSSWERGSNEVNNKLIRRFIPKGSEIAKFTNKEIKRIEQWMNNYPRRIFGYKSANEQLLLISA